MVTGQQRKTSGSLKSPRLALAVRGRARALLPRSLVRTLGREVVRVMVAAGEAGAEMSLSLVDDDEIAQLNRDYRMTEGPTDVLSFSMREGEGAVMHRELLGDVIISVETAARQADAAGHALGDELLHLAVHGLAHLCGYDHRTPEEERIMFGWEAELRQAARISRERGGRAKTRVVPRPLMPASPDA